MRKFFGFFASFKLRFRIAVEVVCELGPKFSYVSKVRVSVEEEKNSAQKTLRVAAAEWHFLPNEPVQRLMLKSFETAYGTKRSKGFVRETEP